METPCSTEISCSDDKSALKISPTSNYKLYQPIQVSLVDEANLWSQFSKLGTEMVVNKTGRQMFPGVKLHFENLNPYKFYKVYMEIAPVDGMRYRFDRNSWAPRGTIETSITSSLIEHSQSPAEGYKWMNKPVDFNIRLTNCLENNNDDTVYLRSMFKYMIIIHVEEGSDMTYRNLLLNRTFPLVKTTFLAVTTYQNHQVKDLKTATNIHAKGVRQKKLKKFEEMYHSAKENLRKRSITEIIPDTSKKPRMESGFSPTSIHRIFSKKDDSEIEKLSPPSSFFPNLNNFYPKPVEFTNRNDLFTSPTLPQYRRFETPILSERIPLTAPLTVHCPSPYAPFEHPPYYTPLLLSMHPQNLPIISSYSSPSFYSNKWSMYHNNCTSNTCGSAALNICPSCRDGYQSCVSSVVSQNTQMFDQAAPSSTTETEVSSSFENSVTYQPSSRNSDSTIISSNSGENESNDSSVSDSISTVVEALNYVYS